MPIIYNSQNSSSTELTTSNIQCTRFYSYEHQSVTNQLKKLNRSFKRVPKSMSMPIIETVKASPQLPPVGADFPYASVTLHLSNRYPQTRPCLNIQLAQNLRMALPSRVGILSNWSLIYSLDQHGASQSTLYQQCKQNSGPCLLVIQDSQFETFGAYLTESLHSDTGYYGTGECFLWKLDSQTEKAHIYPWTMKNDYLVYSDRSSLAVGGSRFGLWIDSDLAHGYTEPSETFDNPPLTLKNSFECIGLEIWGFQY